MIESTTKRGGLQGAVARRATRTIAMGRLSHVRTNDLWKAVVYVLLVGCSLFFVFPFVWMLSTSLKSLESVFRIPVEWIPEQVVWTNYVEQWTLAPFGRYYINSTKIAALSVVGTLFSATLAGYSFARIDFPGREVCFVGVLSTMMIPPQVTTVPVFVLFRAFGWIDTHLALFVPKFFGTPFYVFMMRQFFLPIPETLGDSAKIDGASHLQIFAKIYLPLSKPAVVAVTAFMFLESWNDFFDPLIFLSTNIKFTVPLGLSMIRGEFLTPWNQLMAMSTVALVPSLVVFFVCQKYFVNNLAFAGIKG